MKVKVHHYKAPSLLLYKQASCSVVTNVLENCESGSSVSHESVCLIVIASLKVDPHLQLEEGFSWTSAELAWRWGWCPALRQWEKPTGRSCLIPGPQTSSLVPPGKKMRLDGTTAMYCNLNLWELFWLLALLYTPPEWSAPCGCVCWCIALNIWPSPT